MITILGAVGLAVALSKQATVQPPPEAPETVYWAAVESFSQGRKEQAFGALASLKQADLNRLAKSWEGLASAARKCDSCAERQRFDQLPLRGAVLLHAERDRVERKSRFGSDEDVCDIGVHGRMGERLLPLVLSQPQGGKFVTRFSIGMSLYFRATTCVGHALGWAVTGLNSSPKNPFLTLIKGLSHEVMGTLSSIPSVRIASFDGKGRTALPTVETADRDLQLSRAAQAYESALATEPGIAEARVRLGRVHWRRGRLEAAEQTLTKAISESKGPLLYLAHLFLGRVLEDRGNLEGAIRSYRASTVIEPQAQSGAVALAAALAFRGETDRAREALEVTMSFAGARRTVDPFWNYLLGTPLMGEAFFESLRIEAIP
jgi:tetratricopeptide (TPR) repeat protein